MVSYEELNDLESGDYVELGTISYDDKYSEFLKLSGGVFQVISPISSRNSRCVEIQYSSEQLKIRESLTYLPKRYKDGTSSWLRERIIRIVKKQEEIIL